jgi:hypothetical protein
MADRQALVIGVEACPDAANAAAPHAEGDAAAFAGALERLGFGKEQLVLLLGGQATKTAVESRLRKLSKAPPAGELFVFFAGPAFRQDGRDYLACHDSQADDLAETSVPLRALLDALAACRGGKLVVFLDARGSPEAEPFATAALADFFGRAPAAACFVSHGDNESSHTAGALKAGVWAHHVAEALSGKAHLALEGGRLVTADSLQGYLAQETARTLRAAYREPPAQTPQVFGALDSHWVIADVTAVVAADQPTCDPRLQPLKRGALRQEEQGKVKGLAGYRKFHRLPDRVNASSRKFVAELAADDVKQDVDRVYAAVREHMGYKRRDVESGTDRGTGYVRTPDFEYSVGVDQPDDDPTGVLWRREAADIRNPEVVLGAPFQEVFGSLFDTLVFEFTRPFDLETWVDHLEDEMPAGVKLRTASDCSSCELTIAGFVGVLRLFRDRVEVQGRKTPTSKGLVEAFLHFQGLFAGRRDLQELPLLG